MQTFFKSESVKPSSTSVKTTGPNNDLGNSKFYAKLPASKTFTLKRDPDSGFWYRPQVSGFGLNTSCLNEDNLNFIKILIRHDQLYARYNPLTGKLENELTREKIDAIVKDLDYDSDLWDDIYDNVDIFRSIYNEQDILKTKPAASLDQIHRAKMKASVDFHTHTEHDAQGDAFYKRPQAADFKTAKDFREFVRSRINVFKCYIYLRRCAILFRDHRNTHFEQPLINLYNFLTVPENYEWLKDKLRVLAVAKSGENWNSGLHEWLTCDKTLEAILRTAGLREGIESHLPESIWAYRHFDNEEKEYLCSEFNWLDLQLLLRTPNKYVIFKSRINTVENGHCGAVNIYEKPGNALRGKCTGATSNAPSEDAFHGDLNQLLMNSNTIFGFARIIHEKYNISIFHDSTPVQAVDSQSRKFLVDGTPTDNLLRLESFKTKLVQPHRFFAHCERDIATHQRIVQQTETLKSTEQNQAGM